MKTKIFKGRNARAIAKTIRKMEESNGTETI